MDSLTLVRAWFKVSEKGRQRTLKKRTRNVHAWACGDVLGPAEPALVGRMNMTQVSYNPYRMPDLPAFFYAKPSGTSVEGSLMLMMLPDGSVWALAGE
jgi:hypothetical protein